MRAAGMDFDDASMGIAASSVASRPSYTLQKKDAGLGSVDSSGTFPVPASFGTLSASASTCTGCTATAPAPAPAQQLHVDVDADSDVKMDEALEPALALAPAPVLALARRPHVEPGPGTPTDGGKVPRGSARDRLCCACNERHTNNKQPMYKRYGAPGPICSSAYWWCDRWTAGS